MIDRLDPIVHRTDLEQDIHDACRALVAALDASYGGDVGSIAREVVAIAALASEDVRDLPASPTSLGRVMHRLAERGEVVREAYRLFALARRWADTVGPLEGIGAESFLAIAQSAGSIGLIEDLG